MPIPISSLPHHIKRSIAKKLDLQDYVKFHNTSRDAHALAQTVNTRFTFKVAYCNIRQTEHGIAISSFGNYATDTATLDFFVNRPIRLVSGRVVVCARLTDDLCDSLINFLLTTNSSFTSMDFRQIDCHPLKYNQLLCAANTKSLYGLHPNHSQFFHLPILKHLKHITAQKPLDRTVALAIKTPSMLLYHTNVSSFDVNFILNEWLNGQRDISRVYIYTINQIFPEHVLNGMEFCCFGSVYYMQRTDGHEVSVEITDHSTYYGITIRDVNCPLL